MHAAYADYDTQIVEDLEAAAEAAEALEASERPDTDRPLSTYRLSTGQLIVTSAYGVVIDMSKARRLA